MMMVKAAIVLVTVLLAASTSFAQQECSCGCDSGHCMAGIAAHLSCSRRTAAERATIDRHVAEDGAKLDAYLKECQSKGTARDVEDARKRIENFRKFKEGVERFRNAEAAENARRADAARKEAQKLDEIRRRAAAEEANRKVEAEKRAETASFAQSKESIEDLARQLTPQGGGAPLSDRGSGAAPRDLRPLGGALDELKEAGKSGKDARVSPLLPLGVLPSRKNGGDPIGAEAGKVFDTPKLAPLDPVTPGNVPPARGKIREWVIPADAPPEKRIILQRHLDNRQKSKDDLSTLEKEYKAAEQARDTVTMAQIQNKKTAKESEIATIDIAIEEELKPPSPQTPPAIQKEPPPAPTEKPRR